MANCQYYAGQRVQYTAESSGLVPQYLVGKQGLILSARQEHPTDVLCQYEVKWDDDSTSWVDDTWIHLVGAE
jgi:hypothetical protein